MAKTPPLIGAALSILDLGRFSGWLREAPRDLEIQDFCFGSILSGDWGPFAEAARKALDGFSGRLGIHGPFIGFAIDSADPEVRAVAARRLDQALDVCAALGAVQMVIHSPYSAWDYHNLDNKPRDRARKIERVHACLGAAVKRAEDQGVMLVIENIEDIDPRDRLRLAESFGSEAVKVSLDTGHAHFVHTVLGAPPVDRFVQAAGDRLGHVHLQDVDGCADRHWAVGEGTIPWAAVFRALESVKSQPHLVLELNDSGGIPASMEWLGARGLAR